MGVYCYTLRKGTREIDGMTIGQSAYAYKCHWGDYDSPYVKRMLAAGRRAREAQPDLDLIIMGHFHNIRDCDTPVFKVSTHMSSYLDGCNPGPVVGHLRREGRKLRFYPVKETVDA